MRLYRYYKAEYGLGLLRDFEIRTSIPNALNDPFELAPNIDLAQYTKESCEEFLRADYNIEFWYHREGRQRGFTNKKRFKRWYLRDIPRRAATLLPKVPQNVEDVRARFADDFSRFWRIICGSHVNDSVLMWSHYADNHSGIVVEISTDEPPFSQLGADFIWEVTYSSRKADYRHSNKVEKFQVNMFTVASTKATEWQYESEVRIFIPAPSRVLRDALFLPISPTAIKNVFLGCRCSPTTKQTAIDLLRRNELAHLGLFQSQLSPTEYALEFSTIA